MKILHKVHSGNDPRFKRWVKILKRVDTSKTDGYAFEGDFVTIDRMIEVEAGTLLLCFGREGSMKYNSPYVTLYRVEENRTRTTLFERGSLNEAWALEVRDEIAEIVNQQKEKTMMSVLQYIKSRLKRKPDAELERMIEAEFAPLDKVLDATSDKLDEIMDILHRHPYEVKTFELRDRATTIHVMATKVNMAALNLADKMQFMDAGWAEDEPNLIYVVELPEPCRAAYNPHEWQSSARTFTDAHVFIREHWSELLSGQVIDVEFINGETETQKVNEWLVRES